MIGNSRYGKINVNKNKHCQIKYVDGHLDTSRAIGLPDFDAAQGLDDNDFYELTPFECK